MMNILQTKKYLNLIFLSFILSAVFVNTSHAAGSKQPVVLESSKSFANTVASIKKAMKKKGVAIIFEANHQNMISMVGGATTPSVAIGFAKPQLGNKLLSAESLAGIEMPMRIAVREKANGKVYVIYYKPSYLFAHYNNPKLNKLGKKMDKMIGMFAKVGTK
jgi:uncharacterized protein (DUF302 family)